MIKQIVFGRKYRYDIELDASEHDDISNFYYQQRDLDLIVIPRESGNQFYSALFYWDKPRSPFDVDHPTSFAACYPFEKYLNEIEIRDLELLYED